MEEEAKRLFFEMKGEASWLYKYLTCRIIGDKNVFTFLNTRNGRNVSVYLRNGFLYHYFE